MWKQKQQKQLWYSFGQLLAVWLLLIRFNQCQQEDGNQNSQFNNDSDQQQQQSMSSQELLEMWRGDGYNQQKNSSISGPTILSGLSNLTSTWGEQQNNSEDFDNDVVSNFPVPEINVVVESPYQNNQEQNQNQDQNSYYNNTGTIILDQQQEDEQQQQQNTIVLSQNENSQQNTQNTQNLVGQISGTDVGYNFTAAEKSVSQNQYDNKKYEQTTNNETINSFIAAISSISNNLDNNNNTNQNGNQNQNYNQDQNQNYNFQNNYSGIPTLPLPPLQQDAYQNPQTQSVSQDEQQNLYSDYSNQGQGYEGGQSPSPQSQESAPSQGVSPSPSSFPFPFPIGDDAVRIPSSSPPPGFGVNTFSPTPLPPGATMVPTTPLPPSMIQSLSGLGTQMPSEVQAPSPPSPQVDDRPRDTYYTGSCAGRSDNPGPGTRCGCSNIVPEGYCACAQVFYAEACANPEIANPTSEVSRGYCDVTCNRCECCPSVYEQAKIQGLTTFVEILDTISEVAGGGAGGGASITDSLKNPTRTATVFIPTNEAFRILYEEELGQTKEEFLQKAAPLFQLTSTHVLISLYAASADELLAGVLGTTLATQLPTAYLTLVNEDDTIQGMKIESPGSTAKIVQPDVNGCHSSIHVIDQVLLSYEPENKYG